MCIEYRANVHGTPWGSASNAVFVGALTWCVHRTPLMNKAFFREMAVHQTPLLCSC
jgi:hypothetical protein